MAGWEFGVIKSTIEKERAEMKFFSRLQLGKRRVIEYYNVTLMYASLYGDRDMNRRYGEGVMYMSIKEFQRYPLHISDDVKGKDGRSNRAWTVTARFNPLHFINDNRQLEVDMTLQLV